jgi:AAA domain
MRFPLQKPTKTVNTLSNLLSIKELSLHDKPKPREMLLTVDTGRFFPNSTKMIEQDFLPMGKLCVITGGDGTGKTHLLTQLAISVATGEKWLNYFNVKNPGKVAFLVGEEDKVEIKRRILKALNKKYQFHDDSLLNNLMENLFVMPLLGVDTHLIDDNGKETPFFEHLKGELVNRNFKLIIIDPAIQFMPDGASNNEIVASTFAKKLNSFITEIGNPTFLLAHHSSYKSDLGERNNKGENGLYYSARWIVNIEHIPFKRNSEIQDLPWVIKNYPQFVAFKHVKSNYTKLLEYCILRRDENGFLVFDKAAMEQIREDYNRPSRT